MLSGGGMLLRSPAKDTPVKAGTLPYAFDGETEIACELLAGPTIDLNVMTRRGYCTHSMRRERFAGWLPVKASADRTMVVSNSVVELSALGRDRLAPLDAVADIAPGVTLEFFSDSVAEIFIIELTGR